MKTDAELWDQFGRSMMTRDKEVLLKIGENEKPLLPEGELLPTWRNVNIGGFLNYIFERSKEEGITLEEITSIKVLVETSRNNKMKDSTNGVLETEE